ncbi:MAG: flagellar hook protein FlgE [Chromatiales bacterium]|nr:flagellar hook protein FlgE [Gammaproteobacteria bacterium]MBW6476634.1 flagellar hook protein FlgE [Chromatiales bacterium]
MAFQTSLSGLTAAQTNLSVTGNNIANASTNGFKRSRAEFADIYTSSFSSTSQVGSGVRVANIAQQFSQGNVEFTDNTLDLAITGEGYFIIKDTDGTELFTRAGAYLIDREGYMVNSRGQRLQGYQTDDDGIVNNTTPQDLFLSNAASPASATTMTEINLNVDASNEPPLVAPFDHVDPNTYNYSTSTTIFDSLGSSHIQTLYFVKTADNFWDTYMTVDGTQVGGAETIEFGQDGRMLNPDPAIINYGTFDPANGAAILDLSVDFDASTQFAGESAVNSIVQDGYTSGRISGIAIDSKGVVYARYTNGQSQILGAVAMARFANPNGLQPVGDTNWAQTFASGDIVRGQAGRGTFGQIQSGALEASNVDLSTQLVNMIIAQRDFQANAKMISTEDAITQTIINIR